MNLAPPVLTSSTAAARPAPVGFTAPGFEDLLGAFRAAGLDAATTEASLGFGLAGSMVKGSLLRVAASPSRSDDLFTVVFTEGLLFADAELTVVVREYLTALDELRRDSGSEVLDTIRAASLLWRATPVPASGSDGSHALRRALADDARRRAYSRIEALRSLAGFAGSLAGFLRADLVSASGGADGLPRVAEGMRRLFAELPDDDRHLALLEPTSFVEFRVDVNGVDWAPLLLALAPTAGPAAWILSSLHLEGVLRAGAVLEHAPLEPADSPAVLETALALDLPLGPALVSARALET